MTDYITTTSITTASITTNVTISCSTSLTSRVRDASTSPGLPGLTSASASGIRTLCLILEVLDLADVASKLSVNLNFFGDVGVGGFPHLACYLVGV